MGSYLAGVKAGTLGGLLYIGGIVAFNLVAMLVYKEGVLAAISLAYPQTCPPIAQVNGISAEDCYSSVLTLFLPYIAFLGFFIVLIASGILGANYDRLPGKGAFKGQIFGLMTGGTLVGFSLVAYNVLLVYSGYPTNVEFAVAFPLLTALFGIVTGRLYQRYTRVVAFQKQGEGEVRILLDGNDMTGSTITLAHNSVHKVRAETGDGTSFKEWAPSGGVKLEDRKSFETVLEVDGDGTLSAHVGKKY